MTRDLNMSYICRVPLRGDVIVLENTGCVEVVDEFVLLGGREGGVVLVYLVDFGDEGAGFVVAVSDGGEAVPEGLVGERVSGDGDKGNGAGLGGSTKMMIWASGQSSWTPSMRLK